MQSLGPILLVIWIGVTNLVLGFALATAMGHGPRRMPRLGLNFVPPMRLPTLRLRLPFFKKRTAETATETEPAVDQTPVSPSSEAAIEAPAETSSPASQTSNTVASNAAASKTTASKTAASTLAPPTTADDDGLPLDLVLAQFQQEVAGVRDGLASVNQRVQQCSETPTVEAVDKCVADLKGVGNRLLDQQTESLRAMENCRDGSATSEQLISEMHQEAATQASHIRQTLDEIQQIEAQDNSVDEDCQRLKQHSDALAASCDAIDKSVSQAREQATGDPALASDEATSQHPGDQMEQMDASEALHCWWADDPEHQRPLTMAMIDIDGVGNLNEALGNEQVDGALNDVKALVLAADLGGGHVSEIDPQRFLLLLPTGAAEQSTELVEELRTAINELAVDAEHADLHLSASCAVANARPGDTARALVARAEAALSEAKQFGGNRTFLNEGDFPVPVAGNPEPAVAT